MKAVLIVANVLAVILAVVCVSIAFRASPSSPPVSHHQSYCPLGPDGSAPWGPCGSFKKELPI